MNHDAKLIRTTEYVELRYAARKSDTWPGYHDTAPLGKRGYWVGTHGLHTYLGSSNARALDEFERMYEIH